MRNVQDIRNITAEAGVIASIIQKPELVFLSESLTPNMFTDIDNASIYWAVSTLAKRGATKVDAFSITNILNSNAAMRERTESLTVDRLQELTDVGKLIAKEEPGDYGVMVDCVMDCAFRRDTYNRLVSCQEMCFDASEKEIEQKIYQSLDEVMMNYSTVAETPQFKDVVDDLWGEIEAHQGSGISGYPFKFPSLNQYVTIEPGELVVFAAEQKAGKSMLLLNEAVDLLHKGLSVLYIDSELSSRMFTCRLISHLTGIEFRRVKSGEYTPEEAQRIRQAIEWIKTQRFTHKYIPMFDPTTIYTTVKRVMHTQGGLQVVIIDYFKSASDESDAYANYAKLGALVDLVKNKIAGDLNIAAIGACQATSSGKIADSAKIARNASTIVLLLDKTPEEMEADGYRIANITEIPSIYEEPSANPLGVLTNEYLLLTDGKDIVDHFRWDGSAFVRVAYKKINGKFCGTVKPRNPQQLLAIDMLYNPDVTIKVITGRFGAGKDFLMSAAAIDMIERGKYEKIVYVRNNVEVKNSNPIGHLPGTYNEKMLPFAMPLCDHLGGVESLQMWMDKRAIEVVHLGFIRGRDFRNSIILCSEAENMTREHIQLLIGRVGEGSSLWLNGDFKQTDAEVFRQNSGLKIAIDKLQGHPRFGYVKLQKTERSETAAMADLLD